MAMLTSKIQKLENITPSRTSTAHEERAAYIADSAETSPPFPFTPEDYQPGGKE
jgi:hypothetical protein